MCVALATSLAVLISPLYLQIKQGHGDAAERERERVAILEMAVS